MIESAAFYHPYLYLFLISFIFCFIITYKLTNKVKDIEIYHKYFIICNITLGLWAFIVMFKLLLEPSIWQLYIHVLVLIIATINVWSLMMFIYYYTNTSIPKKIARGSLIPLLLILGITIISFKLNINSYDIYFETKNVAFYTIPFEQDIFMTILIITHFIYGVIGLTVLFLFARNQKHENKSQYNWIILAILTIFIGGLISALRLDPYSNIHIYPAFFSLFFLFIWKSMSQNNLFNILPIARNKVFDNLTQGIIVINQNNNIIDFNKSIQKISGDNKLYSKNIYKVYPTLKQKEISFAEKNRIEDFEIKLNGKIKYYNINIMPLYNNENNYIGSILSFEDISKLKKNQLLLETQQEELKDKNKKLENFADVLSHDIRNPLHVANGYSTLIKNNPENEQYHIKLDKSLNRIENMVDNILKLTKEGKAVEEKTTVDLESVVNESWGMLNLTDATLNIDDTINIEADKSRLKNVFENIFRNSHDHSPQNHKTKIYIGLLDNGFYIEDNGPGVPDDKKDSIFDYGITHSKDGTGIGLAIVKEIVDAHGWTISIHDGEKLSGVRFEIRFEE